MSAVTAHNFSACSDAEIIAAAQAMLRTMPEGPERKRAARKVLCRRPCVMKAGKFLWAKLTRG